MPGQDARPRQREEPFPESSEVIEAIDEERSRRGIAATRLQRSGRRVEEASRRCSKATSVAATAERNPAGRALRPPFEQVGRSARGSGFSQVSAVSRGLPERRAVPERTERAGFAGREKACLARASCEGRQRRRASSAGRSFFARSTKSGAEVRDGSSSSAAVGECKREEVGPTRISAAERIPAFSSRRSPGIGLPEPGTAR